MQPREKIGQTLVRIGAMTEEQVKQVLRRQRERQGLDRMFGDIAVEMQFTDAQTIERILDHAEE